MTPEQKQMEREFKRMQLVVQSASKGQQMIRPNANGYTETQRKTYADYQIRIDRANARIAELKATAAAMVS